MMEDGEGVRARETPSSFFLSLLQNDMEFSFGFDALHAISIDYATLERVSQQDSGQDPALER